MPEKVIHLRRLYPRKWYASYRFVSVHYAPIDLPFLYLGADIGEGCLSFAGFGYVLMFLLAPQLRRRLGFDRA